MSKPIFGVLVIIGAAAGAATAWFTRPMAEPQEIIEKVEVPAPLPADLGNRRDEVGVIKDKIAQASVVEASVETEVKQSDGSSTGKKKKWTVNRGADRYNMIMKLKVENPKHFNFTTNESVRSARYQQYQCRARSAYYQKSDESKMTDEEKAIHQELLACESDSVELEEVNKIWDRPAELENLRWKEQCEINEARKPLYDAEAKMLIRQELLRMGYSDDDSHVIAEDMAAVITHSRNTSEYMGKMD